jgi:hypothetical protein
MLFQHPSILNTLPLNFLYSCINHVYKGANYNQKVTLHPKYELFEPGLEPLPVSNKGP